MTEGADMTQIYMGIYAMKDPATVELGGKLQAFLDQYDFKFESDSDANNPIHIVLTHDAVDAPFRMLSARHLVISLEEATEIAQYAGTELFRYLELCLALGLVQRKALACNPLIINENLNHPENERCLFNCTGEIQSYALQVEGLNVCVACREFYLCLCCEREFEQLDRQLNLLRKGPKYSEK